jgi:hypothetical protein
VIEMAKKKQQPLWLQWFLDRREFLQWLVTLYVALKPSKPAQVIVQPVVTHPPVQVARAITMPLESSAYLTLTVEDVVLTHGTVTVEPGPTSS